MSDFKLDLNVTTTQASLQTAMSLCLSLLLQRTVFTGSCVQ